MPAKPKLRRLIKNFAIEIAVYAVLLVIYFFAVLRFLGSILNKLYVDNLTIYAIAGLGLIVVQAVALEMITSYLIRLLRIDQLD